MSAYYKLRQYCGPIGDEVVASQPHQVGYARALSLWQFAQGHYFPTATSATASPAGVLAQAQLQSFRLLSEWFEARIQPLRLTQAAEEALRSAARKDEKSSAWNGYADRQDARLSESTYHSFMFLLFEFEFLFEARERLKNNSRAFNEALHHLRQKCSRLAGFQRIAHGLLQACKGDHPDLENAYDECLFASLQNTIPVCVHPCPWLHTEGDEFKRERPHFLWDVKNRLTIIVSQLSEPP